MFGLTNTKHRRTARMAEPGGAYAGGMGTQNGIFAGYGIVAGTNVASNLGWRRVEALVAGDKVLTFDNGMQTVVEVRRTTLFTFAQDVPESMRSVVIPAGAMGNRRDLELLPDQGVLVESDAASDANGDPFAVVAASRLLGYRGIRRSDAVQPIEVVMLYFSAPQVIYAEGGALLYCPMSHLAITDMLTGNAQPYDVLSGQDAAFLVDCMNYEDAASHSAAQQATHAVA